MQSIHKYRSHAVRTLSNAAQFTQRKLTHVWEQSHASVRRGDFNTHAAHLNHVRVSSYQPARNTSTTITEQIQSQLDETINIGQHHHHHHHHHYKSTSAQMYRCLLPSVLKPLCFQSGLNPPRTATSSWSIITLVNPQRRKETRVTSLKTCSGCEREV